MWWPWSGCLERLLPDENSRFGGFEDWDEENGKQPNEVLTKEEGVPVPDNTNLSFRAFIMGTSELFKAKDQPPVTTVHNGQEKSIMDFGQFKPDRDFLAVYVGSTGDASLPGSMD